MKFKIIFAPVKTDKTDPIVDAAKEAGATGATIIPARGTGMHEAKTFFGLTLEGPTDIVMFLVEEHLVKQVLEAIKTAGEFDKPGTQARNRYRICLTCRGGSRSGKSNG
jgi:nitrogen regulatory protein PII